MPKQRKKKQAVVKAVKELRKVAKVGAPTLRGRGGYFDGLLGSLGSTIGNHFLPGLGGSIGKSAGNWLGSITGLGDYRVQKNSLLNGSAPPVFMKGDDHSSVITHREYIADVFSSQAFASVEYQINPGILQTFPWLSTVANSYEQYEMLGCIFEYKSTSGAAVSSTNPALGTVIMATQYDSLDLPFSSKVQMESYEYSTQCVASAAAIHPIECAPRWTSEPVKFTRTTGQNLGDVRFNDIGRFTIATQGMQTTSNPIGELWVSYHIRLLKPRINPDVSTDVYFHAVAVFPDNDTSTSLDDFVVDAASNVPVTLSQTEVSGVDNLLIAFDCRDLPSGRYMFIMNYKQTSGTLYTWTTIAITQLSGDGLYLGSSDTFPDADPNGDLAGMQGGIFTNQSYCSSYSQSRGPNTATPDAPDDTSQSSNCGTEIHYFDVNENVTILDSEVERRFVIQLQPGNNVDGTTIAYDFRLVRYSGYPFEAPAAPSFSMIKKNNPGPKCKAGLLPVPESPFEEVKEQECNLSNSTISLAKALKGLTFSGK